MSIGECTSVLKDWADQWSPLNWERTSSLEIPVDSRVLKVCLWAVLYRYCRAILQCCMVLIHHAANTLSKGCTYVCASTGNAVDAPKVISLHQSSVVFIRHY